MPTRVRSPTLRHGEAATATLVEHGFFGAFDFVNYYQLLFIDGEWKILSKAFSRYKPRIARGTARRVPSSGIHAATIPGMEPR